MRAGFQASVVGVREESSGQTVSLQQRFQSLDTLLAAAHRWWQFKPFHHRELFWQNSHPDLCVALNELSDAEVDALEQDGEVLAAWLSPWIPSGRRLRELSSLTKLEVRELTPPERLGYGIPGRKWQQLLAFASCLPKSKMPLLEWCAGKGHLGRLLAVCDDRAVTSLEWQRALCRDGEQLAERSGAHMHFVHCDAFAPEAGDWVKSGADAVALHACGDLHTTLMRYWVRNCGRSLALSPCCYHLLRGEYFEPMSTVARSAQVKLSRDDLHLPLQETVTAGRGVRRHRGVELHWRLAFDELQRELRGVDSYLPVPNVQKSMLSGSFAEFVRWAAERKQLVLPARLDEQEWLARGSERMHKVRRMELVTHLFRRPLEIWLVLDRALFLQERGAHVEIGEFCARELTPRNILVRAVR